MEYSDKVMDHFANPRNTGRIENPSGQGTVGNPTCGDLMTIYIDVDDNEVIQDIKFDPEMMWLMSWMDFLQLKCIVPT